MVYNPANRSVPPGGVASLVLAMVTGPAAVTLSFTNVWQTSQAPPTILCFISAFRLTTIFVVMVWQAVQSLNS